MSNQIATLLLLTPLFLSCTSAQEPPPCSSESAPLQFVHFSDSHIGKLSETSFAKTVAQIAALNPAFTLVTGDLSNDAEDNLELGTQQWATYARLTAGLSPLLNVAGNHDMGYGPPEERAVKRAAYEAILGPTNYTFKEADLKVIVIETSYSRPGMGPMELTAAQLARVEAELAEGGRIIVAGHLPLYYGGRIWGASARTLFSLLKKYKVVAYLHGHTHTYSHMTYEGLPMIGAPSLLRSETLAQTEAQKRQHFLVHKLWDHKFETCIIKSGESQLYNTFIHTF